jgi:uncharacterized protein
LTVEKARNFVEGSDVMRIQVGGLSDGVHEYHFETEPTGIGLKDGFVGRILVDATLDKSGNQLFLKAAVRSQASFRCDRCTSPFESPLSAEFRTCYTTEETGSPHVDPDELQVVPPGFSVIDVGEDVRQSILLAVPLKLLCAETCRGLCPRCGKNLNTGSCECTETMIDSRWEKLREIQQQKLQDPG